LPARTASAPAAEALHPAAPAGASSAKDDNEGIYASEEMGEEPGSRASEE